MSRGRGQSISLGKLSGVGIIPVLFIIGVFLVWTQISEFLGYLSIFASIIFGILYAGLGAYGISRNYRR
jgi:hypothetical protein